MARPTAIQTAPMPAAYTAPGRARNSQPDMSLAPADRADTNGPRRRPPMAKSARVRVRVYAQRPVPISALAYSTNTVTVGALVGNMNVLVGEVHDQGCAVCSTRSVGTLFPNVLTHVACQHPAGTARPAGSGLPEAAAARGRAREHRRQRRRGAARGGGARRENGAAGAGRRGALRPGRTVSRGSRAHGRPGPSQGPIPDGGRERETAYGGGGVTSLMDGGHSQSATRGNGTPGVRGVPRVPGAPGLRGSGAPGLRELRGAPRAPG